VTADRPETTASQIARLRKLAALAINELTGGTIFDIKVDGAMLRELAIKEGLFELDGLHHAPACPANHFHQMRLPTGRCTCGATRHAEPA